MGSASSTTSLDQEPRSDPSRHTSSNNNNSTQTPSTTTSANQVSSSTLEQQDPATFHQTNTPIMTTSINEDSPTINENTASTSPLPAARYAASGQLPPVSPASATPQPIDLTNANTLPYRMERTDTLNTVQQNNVDLNVMVQTDSRVLHQQSNSQEMAASPVVSADQAEEFTVPVVQPTTTIPATKKSSKSKSKIAVTKEPVEQNVACINPPSEVNARLDTQVEVRVYPCNNSNSDRKKKFTQFMVKPEVSVKS
jgi:hypothetical protein